MTSITDPRNNETLFRYGNTGNLEEVEDALGGIRRFEHDAAGNIVKITDTRGFVTTFTFDAMGRRTFRTDPLGNTRTWEHDGDGNLVRMVDERGNPKGFVYDPRNRRILQTNALGDTREWEYDPGDRLIAMEDELDRRTTYGYDDGDRKIRETRPGGGTWEFAYDDLDRLVLERDPEGRTRRQFWDAAGRKLAEIDGNGALLYERIYGAGGDLFFQTDVTGLNTTYARDKLGRATSISREDTATGEVLTTNMAFDATGNLIRTIDPRGLKTDRVHDALNRLRSVTQAAGTPEASTVTFTHDGEGNRIGLTNGLGHTWTFAYDEVNRLVEERDPETPPNLTRYGYDGAGNLVQKIDANGQTTAWVYDDLNRWITRTFPGNRETISYDKVGNRLTISDLSVTVNKTFDPEDRLLTYAVPHLNRTVIFGYDASGQRTSLKIDANLPQTYEWDPNRRLSRIVSPTGAESTFTRDAAGRVTGKTLPNNVTLTQTQDGFGRITRMLYEHPASGVLEDLRYEYDSNNNRTREDSLTLSVDYQYDARNQLIEAFYSVGIDSDGSESFVYDKAGNRTMYTRTQLDHRIERTYAYSASDRLLEDSGTRFPEPGFQACPPPNTAENCAPSVAAIPSHVYGYDGNGNLTSSTQTENDPTQPAPREGTTTYTWNAKNQLTQVTYPDAGFSLYAYFPDSPLRRLRVKRDGEATAFLWDAVTMNPLEDIEVGTGITVATHQHEMAMDSLLASSKAVGTRAYVVDPLNSVRALVNGTGGTPNRYSYFAYGEARSSSEGEANRFRFTGRDFAQTSGLHYARSRYYGPSGGRWLSQDIIGFAGGLNLYAYASLNPATLTDPTGRVGIDDVAEFVDEFIKDLEEIERRIEFAECTLQANRDFQECLRKAGCGAAAHQCVLVYTAKLLKCAVELTSDVFDDVTEDVEAETDRMIEDLNQEIGDIMN